MKFQIISEQKDLLGDRFECSFGPEGGTIGRSSKNDWVLQDADRFISGKHAVIDYRSGAYYLADISRNGVYVNHSNEPLGRGNPHRLFDGDHLRMGTIEIVAHVDEGQDLDLPATSNRSIDLDEVDPLFPEDDEISSLMLLDENEITGEDAFSAVFERDRQEARPPAISRDAGKRPDNAAEPVRGDGDGMLLDTFLKAAGVDPAEFDGPDDPAEVLTKAGELLNELVSGITDLLGARTNMKSRFRLDQTGFMPYQNNPLKLQTRTTESLHQLLSDREGEYMGSLASIREACRDLRWHHDAVLAAMIASFRDYIERLDPDQIEQDFEATHERKPFLKSTAMRKYWEFYCDRYPIITDAGSGALPQQYAEDFVRQYERQLDAYHRLQGSVGETLAIAVPPGAFDKPDHIVEPEEP